MTVFAHENTEHTSYPHPHWRKSWGVIIIQAGAERKGKNYKVEFPPRFCYICVLHKGMELLDEEDVSAAQAKTQEHAWFPRPDGKQERKEGLEPETRERAS